MDIRQGDYIIILMDWETFDLSYKLTGRLKYVKYPNRVEILVEFSYIEPYIFFKPKPTLKWINSDKVKIHYNPISISETILECSK